MRVIETERLVLRGAREGDAAPLFEVFGCVETMRYWSTLPHTSAVQTAELVAGIAEIADQYRYFVIEHESRAVGTAGFWDGNEIGFILHRDLWRQGYGAEILMSLIAHGFEVLGYEAIVADADLRNAASIGLLRKLGFVETGRAERTIQIGADWFDSVYFALERSATHDADDPPE